MGFGIGKAVAVDHGGKTMLMVWDDGRAGELLKNISPYRNTNEGHKIYLLEKKASTIAALDNTGIATEASIADGYPWQGKFPPYLHQKETAITLATEPRCWCLDEMRTGKTSSSLWAADLRIRDGQSKRVLILCPGTTMRLGWRSELLHITPGADLCVADGTVRAAKKALDGGVQYVIMNHEKFTMTYTHIVKWKPDILIIDEATEFKGINTQRGKCLHKLAELLPNMCIWPLTGTPQPKSPMDLFTVGRVIRPDIVPKHMSRWRAMTMVQITEYKWVPNSSSRVLCEEVLSPCTAVKASDVLGMPEIVRSYREVEMPSEIKKMHAKLIKQRSIAIQGRVIDAKTAAELYTREMQLCAGVMTNSNGAMVTVGADSRIQEMIAIAKQVEGKIVVFCHLSSAHNYIAEAVSSALDCQCLVLNGKVTSERRKTEILEEFNNPQGARVLILNPRVGMYGLNLSIADTSVWWVPPVANLQWQQANKRTTKPGKPSVNCCMLTSSNKETKMYQALISGANVQDQLLDAVRGQE